MSSVRRREADHILKLCLGDHLRAYEVVERQLGSVALRAQGVVLLSGAVIAATGFWGRPMAETSEAARACLAAGMLAMLAAAAVALGGVLRLRWLSQELDDEPVVTLLRGLELRDRKSRNLLTALLLFVLGFGLYCAAVAQVLAAAHPA